MPHRQTSFVLPLLVMTLCACVRSTAQRPSPLSGAAVTVESDTYRAQRVRGGDVLELTITATFTNRTADTIVLHPCYDRRPAVALEKWVNGEWRSAVSQACPDILERDAPRLGPADSRTDTVVLSASFRSDTEPRFGLGAVPGLYRMVYWRVHRDWEAYDRLGSLLPKELRVSNAFRVID